jgi:hypothetical protein
MRNPFRNLIGLGGWLYQRKATLGFLSLAGALLAPHNVFAQTTNAFDTASDPAYSGGFSTGENGGFGFGAWTVTITGNGASYIEGWGPSGKSWGLWNQDAHGSCVAIRPFASALAVGQSFSFQSQLNNLFNSDDTNAVVLQDASGNTVFSYWHDGFEANSANGSYSDATTEKGSAVGFDYHYMNFCSFTFTLNSATTYTFSDNTTGYSFTGVLSGAPITRVAIVRANGNGANTFVNGGNFQVAQLMIESSAPPTFIAQTPVPGSYSASRTNVSLQIVAGSLPVNNNTISLKVDGSTVAPAISTVAATTTISYQPASPLSPGALHTVQVIVADSNNSLFTNTWSFTTGSPTLPVTLAGPISDSDNGGAGVVIFNASGDGWLGTNYESNSSRTLYARFSMTFHDLAGESGNGGAFGGLEFYQGTTERSIYGNNWLSLNWSLDVNGQPLDQDLSPSTPIVLNEYHTIVARIDYQAGGNANVNVWLDPDFTKTEFDQPNSPVQISINNTFDQVHLRCGNGSANATWTNIIMGATSTDVGFAAPLIASFQGFVPGMNAVNVPVNSPIGVQVVPGSVGIKTNAIAVNLDDNPVTPVYSIATNKIITVSYQPATAFSAGSSHTVSVNLTDSNGTPYSTSWSFTVDSYPSLPVTFAGPQDVTGGNDVTIFNNANGWIGGNYQSTSTNTLYTRFSMTFYYMNDETGGGGAYGGLEYYNGSTEGLLTGNAWLSTNWSANVLNVAEYDLLPTTGIVLNEWHTMVVKNVFASNAPTAVTIWLDPDFTKTEGGQPVAPLTLTMTNGNTFDTIKLRCGTGSAYASFSNVVLAATAPGVGFAVQPTTSVLSIGKTGGNVNLSWTGTGTLLEAPAITGPWTPADNTNNPQVLNTTNTARFYRIQQ